MQTVNDCILHYLEYVAPNRLKPSTYNVAKCVLAHWRSRIGNVALCDLTTTHILQVRDTYKAPSTANRCVSTLSSALRVAVEHNAIDDNPCARIQPLRVRNTDSGKLISVEHWQAIADYGASVATTPQFHTLLTLLRGTGCRLSEARRLTPNDITQGDNATVVFIDTKSNVNRSIPISADLAQFLLANPLPVSEYRNHWQRAIAATGVWYHYHDIRHTFITEALARGVPPMLLGAYVGHGSVTTSRRYFHPNIEQLRQILP